MLQAYAPASVATDLAGNILYIHGDTGKFLRPAPGPVSLQVVDMAREGLAADLRSALQDAVVGRPTVNRLTQVKTDSGLVPVGLHVRFLSTPHTVGEGGEMLLISFVELPETPSRQPRRKRLTPTEEAGRIAQLEQELVFAKENLQATIVAQHVTNDELKSTNEELQSANEELETSKEELQSLNEETITVNAELNARIEQLSGMQNDIKNLFDNINVGTLFLDHHLTLRRYTREAVKVYRLIPADVGRPLADIKSNIVGNDLVDEIKAVLDSLIPCEREVCTADGAWYLARIQPYRTLDNVIEGVVLTFTDVTAWKHASEAVQRSETLLATAQEMAHLGCWELDIASGDSRWSDEMYRMFDYSPTVTPLPLQKMLDRLQPEDQLKVQNAIAASVRTQQPYDLHYSVYRTDGTCCGVHSRAKPIVDAQGQVVRLIGTTLAVSGWQRHRD